MVSEAGSVWSAPRFIAALSPEDEPTWSLGGAAQKEENLASTVSPDGRFLAFMSNRSLTGYDNRDAISGQPDEEVFAYDDASGQLRCVSCNPSGVRPAGAHDAVSFEECCQLLSDRQRLWRGRWLAADIPAFDRSSSGPGTMGYQSRYLSDEGRLFFDSFDSLVGQDTNGRADVYEYEPPGVGGCASLGGCVSLISSGTSAEESVFLDASGRGPGGHEGEDVFFITQSRLTSQDYDASYDVYDAHTCSSVAPCLTPAVNPPECTSGDSCKDAPSPQPEIFGPAPSATFSGTGNVVKSPIPSLKKRSLTRRQKLARALAGCRKKKGRLRRSTCERTARKRYQARQSRNANTTKKGNR